MMKWLRRAMATRSASNSASASRLSTCLVRDTFCRWSSPKPLPAPSPSLSALRADLANRRWFFACIICHDCGELDEEGQFFEKNAVYTTSGDFTAHPDERCDVCKGYGFLRVGL